MWLGYVDRHVRRTEGQLSVISPQTRPDNDMRVLVCVCVLYSSATVN